MPSEAQIRKRGKPVKIRVKTLPDGTKLRVFVYKSSGKRGGHTTAEKINGKAK